MWRVVKIAVVLVMVNLSMLPMAYYFAVDS